VLPRSARRQGRSEGFVEPRLQRDVEALVAGAGPIAGVYVQHLVTGCGAAVNAGAQFPAASTLKAAILVEAVRRSGGTPPPAMATLLDRMILDSDDRAANEVLARVGGGPAVTATMASLGLTRSLVRAPYIVEDERRPLAISATAQPALRTNFITTPYELARLMLAVHRGALGGGGLRRIGLGPRTVRAQILARLLDVRDATKLVAGLPPGVPVAHKTGYNQEVRHDAGIVYLRRGPVMAVAMTWTPGKAVNGDGFIASVARAARRRLADGGRCGGLPLSGGPARSSGPRARPRAPARPGSRRAGAQAPRPARHGARPR
jgi:beta-lactamase class A